MSDKYWKIDDIVGVGMLLIIAATIFYGHTRYIDWRAKKQIHNFVSEKCLR